MTAGRPTDYTPEIAAIICDRLADGESLRIICSDPDMPGRTTVYQWLSAQPEFANHYAIARDEQADTYADEIIAIADTASDPAVARLQIDARKWVASKLKPKRYGDRTIHAGDADNPVSIRAEAITAEIDPVEASRLYKEFLNSTSGRK